MQIHRNARSLVPRASCRERSRRRNESDDPRQYRAPVLYNLTLIFGIALDHCSMSDRDLANRMIAARHASSPWLRFQVSRMSFRISKLLYHNDTRVTLLTDADFIGARPRHFALMKTSVRSFTSYGGSNVFALRYTFHALSVILLAENLHLLSPLALSRPRERHRFEMLSSANFSSTREKVSRENLFSRNLLSEFFVLALAGECERAL